MISPPPTRPLFVAATSLELEEIVLIFDAPEYSRVWAWCAPPTPTVSPTKVRVLNSSCKEEN